MTYYHPSDCLYSISESQVCDVVEDNDNIQLYVPYEEVIEPMGKFQITEAEASYRHSLQPHPFIQDSLSNLRDSFQFLSQTLIHDLPYEELMSKVLKGSASGFLLSGIVGCFLLDPLKFVIATSALVSIKIAANAMIENQEIVSSTLGIEPNTAKDLGNFIKSSRLPVVNAALTVIMAGEIKKLGLLNNMYVTSSIASGITPVFSYSVDYAFSAANDLFLDSNKTKSCDFSFNKIMLDFTYFSYRKAFEEGINPIIAPNTQLSPFLYKTSSVISHSLAKSFSIDMANKVESSTLEALGSQATNYRGGDDTSGVRTEIPIEFITREFIDTFAKDLPAYLKSPIAIGVGRVGKELLPSLLQMLDITPTNHTSIR